MPPNMSIRHDCFFLLTKPYVPLWGNRFTLFKVIINESHNLKAFLMISTSNIPQFFHKDMNLVSNLISRMSKLFKEVGRVDMRIFVTSYFCPYQGTRQVGQSHYVHFSFLGGLSPKSMHHGTFTSNLQQAIFFLVQMLQHS